MIASNGGQKLSRQSKPHRSPTQEAVDQFTYEAALLYFRMRIAATQHLGQGRQSSGRRSILKSLGEQGPQTVPEMARARSVSRQHVQKLVNGLREDGLVEAVPNPAHRRSVLMSLTKRGTQFLEDLYGREAALFDFLAKGIPLEEIRAATDIVREIRHRLESEAWTRLTE